MDSPIGISMPYSLEAEQAVLASAMLSESALSSVMEALAEDDFYVTAHKAVFKAIYDLFSTGRPVDLVTVSGELGEKLDSIGGISYLTKIMQGVYTTENLRHYIEIIRSKTLLRRLIEAGSAIVDMSSKDEEEAGVILDRSEQLIFEISENRGVRGFYHIGEVVRSAMAILEDLKKRNGKVTGVPTGFSGLDGYTAGLQNSDLIIIAARPGVGKTSLALNMVENASIRNRVTSAVFSMEMSKEQLVNRILSSEALVELGKLRIGNVNAEEMSRLSHALQDIVTAPIYIDDTVGIKVSEIMAKCRRLKMEKGLGLVVIDYLQLMNSGRPENNRATEVGKISRSLKIMAKELNVPVVTLSQLNRAAESEKRRPRISDLRESGSIEQDADIVLLLYNPATDGDEGPAEAANILECIVAKNRSGSVGSVKLAWRGEYTKFTDLAME